MLKNYLSLVVRQFLRNPLFFLINTAGLAIGISAALVIYLIVQYEFDFDKILKNTNNIYRVVTTTEYPGLTSESTGVPVPTANAARKKVPGIEMVAQFFSMNELKVSVPTNLQSVPLSFRKQHNIIFADNDYFKLFDYTWLAGSSRNSLSEPFKVVLTDNRAKLYFGNIPVEQAIGRTIIYSDTISATVAGIVKHFDRPTELIFEEFISLSTVTATNLKDQLWDWDEWGAVNTNTQMFVKIQPGIDPFHVAKQLNLMRDRLRQKDDVNPKKDNTTHFLQAFNDIHFDNKYGGYCEMHGHKPTLFGLLAVSIFLLLLACINFINLTTANASLRAKEIGIRKTLGSGKRQLIFQFLVETFFITLLSTVVSILLIPWLLHVFKDFIRPEISFSSLASVHVAIFLLALVIIVTLLAGIYPAVVLTRFKPVAVMKKQTYIGSSSPGKSLVRKTLSVTQFVIAQILLIATLIVTKQIHYSLNKDLGFRKDAIVSFGVDNDMFSNKADPRPSRLFTILKDINGIERISLAGGPPSSENWMSMNFKFSGNGGQPFETNVEMKRADSSYFQLFGLTLIAGRPLRYNDTTREMIVNQTYTRMLGFKDPDDAIGQIINGTTPIVGVVGDFHARSTKEPIKPLAVTKASNNSSMFHLALKPQSEVNSWGRTLESVEEAYKSVYPEGEFRYEFFDESIAAFYKQEEQVARLLKWSTGMCILISCLGLLGLVIFVTNSRVKEIGIRKVLGASVVNLVTTLSKDFISVVIIASAIAFPIGWWLMHNWLEDFAYRTTLSWWIFFVVALGMLLLSLTIVTFRTIKTAMENPVKSLRTE